MPHALVSALPGRTRNEAKSTRSCGAEGHRYTGANSPLNAPVPTDLLCQRAKVLRSKPSVQPKQPITFSMLLVAVRYLSASYARSERTLACGARVGANLPRRIRGCGELPSQILSRGLGGRNSPSHPAFPLPLMSVKSLPYFCRHGCTPYPPLLIVTWSIRRCSQPNRVSPQRVAPVAAWGARLPIQIVALQIRLRSP